MVRRGGHNNNEVKCVLKPSYISHQHPRSVVNERFLATKKITRTSICGGAFEERVGINRLQSARWRICRKTFLRNIEDRATNDDRKTLICRLSPRGYRPGNNKNYCSSQPNRHETSRHRLVTVTDSKLDRVKSHTVHQLGTKLIAICTFRHYLKKPLGGITPETERGSYCFLSIKPLTTKHENGTDVADWKRDSSVNREFFRKLCHSRQNQPYRSVE